jgi:hypothetical protein
LWRSWQHRGSTSQPLSGQQQQQQSLPLQQKQPWRLLRQQQSLPSK